METLEPRFTVTHRYAVHFTEDLFAAANGLLAGVLASDAGPARAIAVVDDQVASAHPRLLADLAAYAEAWPRAVAWAQSPLLVPGGEAAKQDPEQLERLWRAIDEAGVCRHSYLVAVGGGAVLDLAGFAAATAHRGVRLVRVPTTVLAQNDAGVGVKNGVNFLGKKNFLGAFAPPVAVLNDSRFLATLPERDWIAGCAEAVKVAILKDPAFFAWLEQAAPAIAARDMAAMRTLIHRCAALHVDHIASAGDPFELGSSRPLDLGHWAAHKLERLTAHALRHGEAVAIGLALDATYARLAGLLGADGHARVLALLDALGLPTFHAALDSALDRPDRPESLLAGLREFREHLGGQLTIALPQAIGQAIEVHAIDHARVAASVRALAERTAATKGEAPCPSKPARAQ